MEQLTADERRLLERLNDPNVTLYPHNFDAQDQVILQGLITRRLVGMGWNPSNANGRKYYVTEVGRAAVAAR
jgi:hypothetical protein